MIAVLQKALYGNTMGSFVSVQNMILVKLCFSARSAPRYISNIRLSNRTFLNLMPASVLAAAQNQLYLYSQLSDVSSFKYLSQTLYVFALAL